MPNSVIVSLAILTNALDFYQGEDYYLKLFTDNDYTPDHDMGPSDFTEASGGGYAHKSITGATDWTEEYTNNPPDLVLAEQTYTFTGELSGSATVYGWYLIDQTLTYVRAAKLLDTPFTPASGGGSLIFTPRIQAGNGTPA